jgi:hypothetical protein
MMRLLGSTIVKSCSTSIRQRGRSFEGARSLACASHRSGNRLLSFCRGEPGNRAFDLIIGTRRLPPLQASMIREFGIHSWTRHWIAR